MPYEDVPDVDPEAEVDPHWLELVNRGSTRLPQSYLPASMPGQVTGWRRTAAFVVIVLLVSVTATGICLTYGPEELFSLIG
jgi:hypothetical protein